MAVIMNKDYQITPFLFPNSISPYKLLAYRMNGKS